MALKLSTETQEIIYKRRRLVEGVECDVCKKIITPKDWKSPECRYFHIITGHHDWGNDSIDSIEHYDVCPHCVGKFMTDYLSRAKGTEYLDVETRYMRKNMYEYDD